MIQAGDSNSNDEEPVKGTARWKPRRPENRARVLDTTMRVTTPENISFQYQIAGPFRRIYAYLLDILVSLAGYGLFVFLSFLLFVFVVLPLAGWAGGSSVVTAIGGILAGLTGVGYFLVYWFYGAFCEARFNGQTLGKRVAQMRVITVDGHAIDGVQAMLRNFFRLLDLMPLVSFTALFQLDFPTAQLMPTCLFGLLIMTLTPKFQRVGDLVANTVVVNEDRAIPPHLASFADGRVPLLAEEIPAGFVVSASLSRALADYVDHRNFLAFQRSSEIAGYVAKPLLEKFGLPADTDHDLFLCALYYKTFSASINTDPGSSVQQSEFQPNVNLAEEAVLVSAGFANDSPDAQPGSDPSDIHINTDQ